MRGRSNDGRFWGERSYLWRMFVLLGSVACFAPTFTHVTVSEFANQIWQQSAGDVTHVSLGKYSDGPANETYYVVRQGGELPTGWNYTYYYVSGTKEEIAILNTSLSVVLDEATNISSLPTANVVFLMLKPKASDNQASLFWINIIVWLFLIGGALTALLLWHCDNYAKDPANSLLFVTDGSRIVSGE